MAYGEQSGPCPDGGRKDGPTLTELGAQHVAVLRGCAARLCCVSTTHSTELSFCYTDGNGSH